MKLLPACVLLLLITAGTHCRTKLSFGKWRITAGAKDADGLAWSAFHWKGQQLGSRYYARTAMYLPATVKGFAQPVTFQFDLGSNLTVFYGNPLSALAAKEAKEQDYGPISLSFGGLRAATEHAYVMTAYGAERPARPKADDTLHLGSLGTDIFQNKVLIIDYPGQRFAVCDTVPASWRTEMTAVALDDAGRMVLPLSIGGKTLRALFDNGSSLFPLLVPAADIGQYTQAAPGDTIPVTSWGKPHNVVGRPLRTPFVLGGRRFTGTTVYADDRPEALSDDHDAVAGNALFWDEVIILDFRNRRFGVQVKQNERSE